MRYLLKIEIATEKIKNLRQEQNSCQYKGKEFTKWHNKLIKAIKELENVLVNNEFELEVIKQFYGNV